MLKISLICFGKYKEKAYLELEKVYLNRMAKMYKLKILELPEIPYSQNSVLENIKFQEWSLAKKYLSDKAVLITLQENGELFDSVAFSNKLEQIGFDGTEIIFLLGSGIGLHQDALIASQYTWSLSSLTFPHNLARLVLLEQLYRAGTIYSGKSYHK